MFPLGATPGRLGDNFFRENAHKAVPLASNRRNDATNVFFLTLSPPHGSSFLFVFL